MLKDFENHIKNTFPFLQEEAFLLACSGGVDSVVLAHLCSRLNLDFSIAHCNFKLRGAASDADGQFVEELSKVLGKKFHTTTFDTNSYVDLNKVSVQMAARELRYQWFSELMQKYKYSRVLTAHQADDDLETFLINLSRGTGIDGLSGIPALTDSVARPLLPFSRNQIVQYANKEGLAWQEDSSNTDTKYLRNKIRHEIVPKLKELHPTFLDNFLNTKEFLQQTSEIAGNDIAKLKAKIFKENKGVIKIAIDSVLTLKPLKGYIYALFKDYGFTEWEDVQGLLKATSGKEVRSKTHRLLKDRRHLLLQKLMPLDDSEFKIEEHLDKLNWPLKLTIKPVLNITNTSQKILYVDKETLKYPLTVRKWRKGDYFYPFGMQGRKKVSKFFKDQKMDTIAKEEQWFLCSGGQIVWIIGRRSDRRYSITEKTKSILKFTLEE
ncbi:tRNA lysidine(34) synthetase TilS [Spongiimicrobium sp. 3-5]|uniref:tRNA lysidine(34) synthetase TilS n=1 Tax=Spongiimicrobium sp. 3-5 TaxID=3332596 RepID=UPI00397FEB76